MQLHIMLVAKDFCTPFVSTREIPLALVHDVDVLLKVAFLGKGEFTAWFGTRIRAFVGVSTLVCL